MSFISRITGFASAASALLGHVVATPDLRQERIEPQLFKSSGLKPPIIIELPRIGEDLYGDPVVEAIDPKFAELIDFIESNRPAITHFMRRRFAESARNAAAAQEAQEATVAENDSVPLQGLDLESEIAALVKQSIEEEAKSEISDSDQKRFSSTQIDQWVSFLKNNPNAGVVWLNPENPHQGFEICAKGQNFPIYTVTPEGIVKNKASIAYSIMARTLKNMPHIKSSIACPDTNMSPTFPILVLAAPNKLPQIKITDGMIELFPNADANDCWIALNYQTDYEQIEHNLPELKDGRVKFSSVLDKLHQFKSINEVLADARVKPQLSGLWSYGGERFSGELQPENHVTTLSIKFGNIKPRPTDYYVLGASVATPQPA